jgi:multicomponent Na+:H+ antiporter subunit B
MRRLILQTATRFMLPLLILFSVFLLLRGHNQPGGGFTGGLVGAAAFALYSLAYDVRAARQMLWINPRSTIGGGLIVALGSAALPLAHDLPFFSNRHYWVDVLVPAFGIFSVGPPLFFDFGVYLVVIGVVLTIIWTLEEE